MRIRLFLPHVGVFGGVRRFIELGNAWTASGHDVTLLTPDGHSPGWIAFHGRVAALDTPGGAELAVCADPHTLDAFAASAAAIHLYYCVIEGDPGVARARHLPSIRFAANSGALRRGLSQALGREVLDGIGGINPSQFRPASSAPPASPLRVLVNGRRSRPKKGTDLVLRALAGLGRGVPPFEVVLFDTLGEHNRQDPRDGAPLPPHARFVLDPTQAELVALYQSSHLFVAAERKAGWCNTALEAMACGVAVVCTRSGTGDFARDGENALVVPVRHPWFLGRGIRRVLTEPALRLGLAAAGPAAAAPWAWDTLARRLLAQLPELT